jgi:hypothetical protein
MWRLKGVIRPLNVLGVWLRERVRKWEVSRVFIEKPILAGKIEPSRFFQSTFRIFTTFNILSLINSIRKPKPSQSIQEKPRRANDAPVSFWRYFLTKGLLWSLPLVLLHLTGVLIASYLLPLTVAIGDVFLTGGYQGFVYPLPFLSGVDLVNNLHLRQDRVLFFIFNGMIAFSLVTLSYSIGIRMAKAGIWRYGWQRKLRKILEGFFLVLSGIFIANSLEHIPGFFPASLQILGNNYLRITNSFILHEWLGYTKAIYADVNVIDLILVSIFKLVPEPLLMCFFIGVLSFGAMYICLWFAERAERKKQKELTARAKKKSESLPKPSAAEPPATAAEKSSLSPFSTDVTHMETYIRKVHSELSLRDIFFELELQNESLQVQLMTCQIYFHIHYGLKLTISLDKDSEGIIRKSPHFSFMGLNLEKDKGALEGLVKVLRDEVDLVFSSLSPDLLGGNSKLKEIIVGKYYKIGRDKIYSPCYAEADKLVFMSLYMKKDNQRFALTTTKLSSNLIEILRVNGMNQGLSYFTRTLVHEIMHSTITAKRSSSFMYGFSLNTTKLLEFIQKCPQVERLAKTKVKRILLSYSQQGYITPSDPNYKIIQRFVSDIADQIYTQRLEKLFTLRKHEFIMRLLIGVFIKIPLFQKFYIDRLNSQEKRRVFLSGNFLGSYSILDYLLNFHFLPSINLHGLCEFIAESLSISAIASDLVRAFDEELYDFCSIALTPFSAAESEAQAAKKPPALRTFKAFASKILRAL